MRFQIASRRYRANILSGYPFLSAYLLEVVTEEIPDERPYVDEKGHWSFQKVGMIQYNTFFIEVDNLDALVILRKSFDCEVEFEINPETGCPVLILDD